MRVPCEAFMTRKEQWLGKVSHRRLLLTVQHAGIVWVMVVGLQRQQLDMLNRRQAGKIVKLMNCRSRCGMLVTAKAAT